MPWWRWRRWGAAGGVLVVGGGAVLGFPGSPCPAVVVLVVLVLVEAVVDARGSWSRVGWWWRW